MLSYHGSAILYFNILYLMIVTSLITRVVLSVVNVYRDGHMLVVCRNNLHRWKLILKYPAGLLQTAQNLIKTYKTFYVEYIFTTSLLSSFSLNIENVHCQLICWKMFLILIKACLPIIPFLLHFLESFLCHSLRSIDIFCA